jgi:hypothetical protein
VLVVASQCRAPMGRLIRLEQAATDLYEVFRDPGPGACEPGLPGDQDVALVYGELDVDEIRRLVKSAIRYAAESEAVLVLALLGHGFIAGSGPRLYFMGWDSRETARLSAIDVPELLLDAADTVGIRGVIGIVDTCTAAGAQPGAELTTGNLGGQTRLSLMMASGMGEAAYGMNLATNLARLLRSGVAGAGKYLRLAQIDTELRPLMLQQTLVTSEYNGADTEGLWIAQNAHARRGTVSLGRYGTAELTAALETLDSDRNLTANRDESGLEDLRREIDLTSDSPARTRALRVLDSLLVARKTVSFLRSSMPARLSTQRLRSALAVTGGSQGSPLLAGSHADISDELDAVEYAALSYPRMDKSCRPQMARFVVELAGDADLHSADARLREWAASIGATVNLNDALAAHHQRHAERRLRLVVSLHYALTGGWPEELGAWLLLDGEFDDHKDFGCTPDQKGAEQALGAAVSWAEERAEMLGVSLRRVEVAVPVKVMLRWRPEEVEYGPFLGVNYDVVTRWSQRLDPTPDMTQINNNARHRLAEIAASTNGDRLHWLRARKTVGLDSLEQEFLRGRYAGAIGLIDNPGLNEELLGLLLRFAPIVLWPRRTRLTPRHQRLISSYWDVLPVRIPDAYRARWRAERQDLIADIRAVWDDEEWLAFCESLRIRPKTQPGSQ